MNIEVADLASGSVIGIYRRMVDKNKSLHPYFEQLAGRHGAIRRIGCMLEFTGWEWQDLAGETVIDIAGGNIGSVDGSHAKNPRHFPWFSTVMTILGANAYNLDRMNGYTPDNLSRECRGLMELMSQCFTLVESNLDQELLSTNSLIDRLRRDYAVEPGSVRLINCELLVSLGADRRVNSPKFMQTLKIDCDWSGDGPFDVPRINRKLANIQGGVIQFALEMLKEGGVLYLNQYLYKKTGDKFLWIPMDRYFQARKEQAEAKRDRVGGMVTKEGKTVTLRTDYGVYRKCGRGWSIDWRRHNELEPVP